MRGLLSDDDRAKLTTEMKRNPIEEKQRRLAEMMQELEHGHATGRTGYDKATDMLGADSKMAYPLAGAIDLYRGMIGSPDAVRGEDAAKTVTDNKYAQGLIGNLVDNVPQAMGQGLIGGVAGTLKGVKDVSPGVTDASEAFQNRGKAPLSTETKIAQMNGQTGEVRDAMPELISRAGADYDEARTQQVPMDEIRIKQKSAYDNSRNAPPKADESPYGVKLGEKQPVITDAERLQFLKDNDMESRSMHGGPSGDVAYRRGKNGEIEYIVRDKNDKLVSSHSSIEDADKSYSQMVGVQKETPADVPPSTETNKTYYKDGSNLSWADKEALNKKGLDAQPPRENILYPKKPLTGPDVFSISSPEFEGYGTRDVRNAVESKLGPKDDYFSTRDNSKMAKNEAKTLGEIDPEFEKELIKNSKNVTPIRKPDSLNAVAPQMPNDRRPDSVPASLEAPSGLSAEQEKRFQELHAKYGQSSLSPQDEKRFQELHAKFGPPKGLDANAPEVHPEAPVDMQAAQNVTYPNSEKTGKRTYGTGIFDQVDKYRDEHPDYHPEPKMDNEALGRVADYSGGLVRTAGAGLLGMGMDKNPVSAKDIGNTFLGKAPTSSEYLEKAGAGDLGSVDLKPYQGVPGVGQVLPDKITGRGLLGFGLDTAAGGVRKGAFGQAVEDTGRNVYKSGFKKIQERLDESPRKPIPEIAPIMEKEGFTGSLKEALPEMRDIRRKYYDETKDIMSKADQAGAQVDMNQATSHAQDYINDLKKNRLPDGSQDKQIQALQDSLDEYKNRGARTQATPQEPHTAVLTENTKNAIEGGHPEQPMTVLRNTDKGPLETPFGKMKGKPVEAIEETVPGAKFPLPEEKSISNPHGRELNDPLPELKPGQKWADERRSLPRGVKLEDVPGPSVQEANEWKKTLYKQATDRAYQENVTNPIKREFEKRLARGHKEAIESATSKALGEEAGNKLAERNSDVGTMLGADKHVKVQARKEVTPNLLSQTDVMFPITVGALTSHDPVKAAIAGLLSLGAKKTAQFANTARGRTNIGMGLMKTGQSGLVDAATSRGLINASRDERK